MQRISAVQAHDLHDVAATRALELSLAAGLAPHTLMQRAGLAAARLALAIAPHASRFWVACGPGNNGGDGLEAAAQLQQQGKHCVVSWLGNPAQAPADARASWQRARAAGVEFADEPVECDAAIDALLGIGAARAPQGRMADWIVAINRVRGPVLAIDLPSGINADTGCTPGLAVTASHTLSLLTLKPGLYTASGRDHAGQIWLDTLDDGAGPALPPPCARLNAWPDLKPRRHASHKGSYGDVAVVGGAPSMAGAALLAANAALRQGAGRVFLCALDPQAPRLDGVHPELMMRPVSSLDLRAMTVVAGCGGGESIRDVLPAILSQAPRLVLDADALNAAASDPALMTLIQRRRLRGWGTVLTPHPLEAARLLNCDTSALQADRLEAARRLSTLTGACVVLKGSGTVIASPDQVPCINPTGNPRLATAGAGDVLAGLIAGVWASGFNEPGQASDPAFSAACAGVWIHGRAADLWPATEVLTAGALAERASIYAPTPPG